MDPRTPPPQRCPSTPCRFQTKTCCGLLTRGGTVAASREEQDAFTSGSQIEFDCNQCIHKNNFTTNLCSIYLKMKLSTVTMILAIAFAFFCPVAATTTSTKMMIPAVPETMITLALIEMPAFGLNSTVATMMEFNTTTTASTVSSPTLLRLADKIVRKTCLVAIVAIVMTIWGYVAAIEAIALFLGFAPTTIAFALPLVCCLSWDYYWSNEEDDIEHDNDTTVNDTACPRPVYVVHVETIADEEEDCAGVNQRDEYVEDDQYTNYPEDCCFEQDGEKVEDSAQEEEELKVDDNNDYCDEEEEEEEYYDEDTQEEDDERYEEEDMEEEEEEEEYHEEDIEEEEDEYYCYEEDDYCHEEDIDEEKDENSDEEASVETETRPPFQVGDLVRVTGGKHKGHTGRIFRLRGGKGLTWDISLDRSSCGQTIVYKPPHMLLRLDSSEYT